MCMKTNCLFNQSRLLSHLRTATPRRRSPLRRGFFPMLVLLAMIAVSPTARPQLPSPTPDGGYPNGNTAENDSALFSLTTGLDNTAIGNHALFSNTTGSNNTANGWQAMAFNTIGSHNT